MKNCNVVIVITLLALPIKVMAQNTVPIDVIVDTGSHICTSLGQERKVYKDIYAGKGRYFVNESLGTVSKFREGDCQYTTDGGGPAVQTEKFKFTDADGAVELMDKPTRYVVRAFGDCTNNLGNIGKTMGTECRFTATSKKGNQ